jgi:hypothetical protein
MGDEVFGKVVDAETGKPVEAFVTQAGKEYGCQGPSHALKAASEPRRCDRAADGNARLETKANSHPGP